MKAMVRLCGPLLVWMCCSCAEGPRNRFCAAKPEPEVLPADTMPLEDEDEEEEAVEEARMDEYFDDFIYSFLHSRRLQRERVGYPLPSADDNGEPQLLHKLDCRREFAFLRGDFYTVLYGNTLQINEQKERPHETVLVERIMLDSLWMRVYNFERRGGKWLLTAIHRQDLHQGELSDFLAFYSRFSSDSLFQQQSIAQPLSYSLLDSEADEEYIEGTIDASQWASFGAVMPSGEITNIRYGQTYNPHHVVMQKCGLADGMQELFTFEKRAAGWRLVAYEN